MEEMLRDLIGANVELRSNSGAAEYTDRGTLEAVTDRWCRLRAADGSLLCFPIANIRLIKGTPQRVNLPVPASPAPPDSGS